MGQNPGPAELVEPRLGEMSLPPQPLWWGLVQGMTEAKPVNTRSLLSRTWEMASLSIPNPLDQCCAIRHSVKIEKWCHKWLLNT